MFCGQPACGPLLSGGWEILKGQSNLILFIRVLVHHREMVVSWNRATLVINPFRIFPEINQPFVGVPCGHGNPLYWLIGLHQKWYSSPVQRGKTRPGALRDKDPTEFAIAIRCLEPQVSVGFNPRVVEWLGWFGGYPYYRIPPACANFRHTIPQIWRRN